MWPAGAVPLQKSSSVSPEVSPGSAGEVIPDIAEQVEEADSVAATPQDSKIEGVDVDDGQENISEKLRTVHGQQDVTIEKQETDAEEQHNAFEEDYWNQEIEEQVNENRDIPGDDRKMDSTNTEETEKSNASKVNIPSSDTEYQPNDTSQGIDDAVNTISESEDPFDDNGDSEADAMSDILSNLNRSIHQLLGSVDDTAVSLQAIPVAVEDVISEGADDTAGAELTPAELRADLPYSLPEERARIAIFPSRGNIDKALLLLRDLQRMLEERLDVFNIMLDRFYRGELQAGDRVAEIKGSLGSRRRYHHHHHHGYQHHHFRGNGTGNGRRPGGNGVDAHQFSDGHGPQQQTIINLYEQSNGNRKKNPNKNNGEG